MEGSAAADPCGTCLRPKALSLPVLSSAEESNGLAVMGDHNPEDCATFRLATMHEMLRIARESHGVRHVIQCSGSPALAGGMLHSEFLPQRVNAAGCCAS